MRHNVGVNLADFGFGFLEKLHEPIFLVHRLGQIVKMNEAGRKLLRVVKQSPADIESFVASQVLTLFSASNGPKNCERIPLGNRGHQLVARNLLGSDFILVEVLR